MRLLSCILTENDCYQAGRTIQPKGIMIHSTGANNPTFKRYVQPDYGLLGYNRNGNHWNRGGVKVCVHGFVGKLEDGTVATYQTLPWNHRGWHAGGSANNTHISFEICEDGLSDPEYFAAVYQESVELVAYLCKEYQLDPLADGVVTCHSEGYSQGTASNHGDVMHWFPRHGKSMDTFRQDVAEGMKVEEMEVEAMTVEQFTTLFQEMQATLRDNDSSSWSQEAREWAVEQGLITGGSGAEFNGMWKDFLTREQMVTILYRFSKAL